MYLLIGLPVCMITQSYPTNLNVSALATFFLKRYAFAVRTRNNQLDLGTQIQKFVFTFLKVHTHTEIAQCCFQEFHRKNG